MPVDIFSLHAESAVSKPLSQECACARLICRRSRANHMVSSGAISTHGVHDDYFVTHQKNFYGSSVDDSRPARYCSDTRGMHTPVDHQRQLAGQDRFSRILSQGYAQQRMVDASSPAASPSRWRYSFSGLSPFQARNRLQLLWWRRPRNSFLPQFHAPFFSEARPDEKVKLFQNVVQHFPDRSHALHSMREHRRLARGFP